MPAMDGTNERASAMALPLDKTKLVESVSGLPGIWLAAGGLGKLSYLARLNICRLCKYHEFGFASIGMMQCNKN
jgi:hypothetical protein